MALFLFILFVVQLGFGAAGAWICALRDRSPTEGFLLGFFLSGVGLLVAALLPRPLEAQAREAIALRDAIERHDEPDYRGSSPISARHTAVPPRSVDLPQVSWEQVRLSAAAVTGGRGE